MGIREAWAALRGTVPWEYIHYETPEFVLGLTPADLWRTQPHLRTVIDFLARNIAQLGLHTFELVSETDRRRLRDDPMAQLISRPNSHATSYDLVHALVGDLALYNEAFWWLAQDSDAQSGWSVEKLSPSWVTARGGDSIWTIDWVEFVNPKSGKVQRVTRGDGLIWFPQWNPGDDRNVSSPVDALKDILSEQISARKFRNQMWRKGGRFGGYLSRPVGAQWDKETRKKFSRQWSAAYSGNDGSDAGGTPILEDGMEYKTNRFSAREEDWLEGTKLSLAQVASVYQVNPTMVGLLDNANFSNVEAFRKMLYSDTLGPTLTMIQDRLNTFIVPMVTSSGVYVEFNVAEKLKGSFEEQAAALQTSVGAPWVTRDEARGRMNLPSLPGGDQLVTPLNVIMGVPSSEPQPTVDDSVVGEVTNGRKSASVRIKGKPSEPQEMMVARVLSAFFVHQKQVTLSKLGAKASWSSWWDQAKWDKELADDLYQVAVSLSQDVGEAAAKRIGFDASDYDVDRTLAFLRAVTKRRAQWINETTRIQLERAINADDPKAAAESVFTVAEGQRSGSAGGAVAAMLTGWAVTEAVQQLIPETVTVTKTWMTGTNPRPSHAAMNGESVPRGEPFSNGAQYPGDSGLDADEVAGCNCTIVTEINY